MVRQECLVSIAVTSLHLGNDITSGAAFDFWGRLYFAGYGGGGMYGERTMSWRKTEAKGGEEERGASLMMHFQLLIVSLS